MVQVIPVGDWVGNNGTGEPGVGKSGPEERQIQAGILGLSLASWLVWATGFNSPHLSLLFCKMRILLCKVSIRNILKTFLSASPFSYLSPSKRKVFEAVYRQRHSRYEYRGKSGQEKNKTKLEDSIQHRFLSVCFCLFCLSNSVCKMWDVILFY